MSSLVPPTQLQGRTNAVKGGMPESGEPYRAKIVPDNLIHFPHPWGSDVQMPWRAGFPRTASREGQDAREQPGCVFAALRLSTGQFMPSVRWGIPAIPGGTNVFLLNPGPDFLSGRSPKKSVHRTGYVLCKMRHACHPWRGFSALTYPPAQPSVAVRSPKKSVHRTDFFGSPNKLSLL